MSDPNLFAAARAKKSLGQHFLRDEAVLQRIAALAGAEPGDRLMEIGPGPGALTALLREMPWERLLLLEKDDHYAAEHAARPLPGLEVVPGDALDFPWESLDGPWKIIGNLPYNVASPLMWEIVQRVPTLARGVFMIQKEVADRILAQPGTKDYGALTVWIKSFVAPRKGFVVGPGAFAPPPKVDSAVVVFDPIPVQQRPERPDLLARLVKLCFSQRRKQLQGILRHAGIPGYSPSVLEKLSIDPAIRPETLSPSVFQILASRLWS